MKANAAQDLAAAFGFLYPGEVELLKRLAGDLPEDGVIVNVGAGAGTSGLALREGNLTATIYTVDISPGGPLGGMENERIAFRKADIEELLPVQILGDSRTVGKAWDRGSADLVFIDDGHDEAEVRGDIECWLPHVKAGGVIAFHDYEAEHWPTVKRVVDELMDGYEIVDLADTTIAFRTRT